MYPELLQLGPVTIYSLWAFLILGFFSTLISIVKFSKFRSVKLNFLAENSLLIFFSGLIFSRIFFIVRNYQYFFEQISNGNFGEIFYIWDKGLSIWGAFFGIILSMFILCRREKEDFSDWMDIILLSSLIGMIFGNIGTFLDGSNYGTPTSLPWGFIVESSRFAVAIHPVQLYASIYSLLLAITITFLFNNTLLKINGRISLLIISSYSLLRFLDEFMRGDEANIWFGLREFQYYCLLAFGIGVYFLYKEYQKEIKQS